MVVVVENVATFRLALLAHPAAVADIAALQEYTAETEEPALGDKPMAMVREAAVTLLRTANELSEGKVDKAKVLGKKTLKVLTPSPRAESTAADKNMEMDAIAESAEATPRRKQAPIPMRSCT